VAVRSSYYTPDFISGQISADIRGCLGASGSFYMKIVSVFSIGLFGHTLNYRTEGRDLFAPTNELDFEKSITRVRDKIQ